MKDSTLKIKIRKYEKEDHDKVCKMYYDGIMENWLTMYRRTINLQAPVSTLVQIIQMVSIYHYLAAFEWFLLAQFFIQTGLMMSSFIFHWLLAW